MMQTKTKKIAESAMLIAIGTVLSLITFKGPWALGGGITVCSMLPLVMLSHRYGTKWGVMCSLVFSLLQIVLGLDNVSYAPTAFSAVIIILFDYILAFGAIGLSSSASRTKKRSERANSFQSMRRGSSPGS